MIPLSPDNQGSRTDSVSDQIEIGEIRTPSIYSPSDWRSDWNLDVQDGNCYPFTVTEIPKP
jgi:hypothetical protein